MKIRIKAVKKAIFLAIILPIAAILPVSLVNADIVQHLYEAEAPVEGQGREERAVVVREALKEVLVRISGRESASALALDESLVPKPTRLVQQFRYIKFAEDEVIPATPDGANPYTQKLWLRFTEKAVAKLLREQGLPVWGKTRPATLLWLAVDDQKQRTLIGNSSPNVSRSHIEREAKKRGLPFRLPLLDLTDQLKLQVTDVWGNFEETILSASMRYQTEGILVGRVYLNFSNTWHTRWTLYLSGQRHDWETSNSANLSAAITEGIAVASETLSLQFTRVNHAESNDSVMLKVKNIHSLSAYNKAIKYLSGLSAVSEAQAYQVNNDNVIFKLKGPSGRIGITQAISLGHMLVPEVDEPVSAEKKPAESESNEDKVQQLKVDFVYKLLL